MTIHIKASNVNLASRTTFAWCGRHSSRAGDGPRLPERAVPPPAGAHELVSAEVRAALWSALPAHLVVVGPIGVVVGRSYLIPDLVVTARAGLRGVQALEPTAVALAVEVVSTGSVTMDRVAKPAQYAAAGIPAFWRVETDPLSLAAYELAGGVHREVGSWRTGETALLATPFPVEIEIDRLLGSG